jgi:Amt family ammonium transporter
MFSKIDSGDTAWMLISTALAFLMLPGIAFFYGGILRKKNPLSILTMCLMVLCIGTLQWMLYGYSLSFGPDHNGWIGSLAWVGLRGVGGEPNIEYCSTVPHLALMIFQGMVSLLALALILGALAERIKFSSACLFILLWTTLVYDPIAHWAWGTGGFLRTSKILDFAGGTVIHLNAGATLLAAGFVLHERPEKSEAAPPAHHLPFAALGAILLWFGWFGLNTGNSLGASALTVHVFAATQAAAAASALTWAVFDWILHKHPSIMGILMGAISGLVAISPAAGFVEIGPAIVIGMVAAGLVYTSFAMMEKRVGYRDHLYGIGVHGIGAVWGILAAGLWASKTANINGADGFFYGNPGQLALQIKALLAVFIYSFGMSYLLFKTIDLLIGLEIIFD